MHPFEGQVEEIPLTRTPLVKVVCQVRFPRPLGFSSTTIEAARDELALTYPVAREKRETVVVLSQEGVSQQKEGGGVVWTMSDIDNSWQIVLAEQFVAIETNRYSNRGEFTERIGELLKVVHQTYLPPVFDRIGVRYINRIDDPSDLELLDKLVNPVALSGLAIPHDTTKIVHSLTDTLFRDDDCALQARWGWLPGGAIIDPGTPVTSSDHWLLDIDVFSNGGSRYDPKVLENLADQYAEKAYRFFRWVVTEDFISHFGGEE